MQARQMMPTEFVEELSKNPNVERVTPWTIRYTTEFKQHAYEEYMHGRSMRQIFTESGIDAEKLGAGRMGNFRHLLLKKADSAEGFADARKTNPQQKEQSTQEQMAKRIRELEHRNAYLEQENEFLKKNRELEKMCVGKVENSRC